MNYNGFVFDNGIIIKYKKSGGNVVIPEKINGVEVTGIGDYAFSNLNISSVLFPDTIITIGDYAFSDNNISNLEIPDSVEKIGEGAFIHNKIVNLVYPKSTFLGNACFNDNLLELDNAFFYRGNELISYGGYIKGNVVIPNETVSIGNKAFYETYIVSLTFPDSVVEIKKDAFKSNYLIEVFLSNNIKNISDDAFINNDYLVSITIDAKKESIDNYPWGADETLVHWLK